MKIKAHAAVGLALMALVGCTLTQNELRKNGLLPPLARDDAAEAGGRKILPKRCGLKFVLLTRPAEDEALGQAVWRVADSQALPDPVRQALAANGLRVGLVTGELPAEVRTLLDAPPPDRVDPALVVLPSGESTLVELGQEPAALDLIVDRDGKAVGKVYEQAKGFLRLNARHDEKGPGVLLRIVPEVHHGPVQRSWSAVPGTQFDPQQLTMKDGQREEAFRDLAAELDLREGQVAVVGGVSGKSGSLGGFLFSRVDPKGDRLMQRVLFVWASRSDDGDAANFPATATPPGLQPVDPPDMPAAH